MGSLFVVLFWSKMAGISPNQTGFGNQGIGPIKGRPPEALLWYNPFAAEYDVICGASDGYGGWCSRLAVLTNGAISIGIGGGGTGATTIAPSDPVLLDPTTGRGTLIDGKAIVNDVAPVQPFGVRRDSFWPRSVVAWMVLSVILILASVQLVSPTRRWRPGFLRRTFGRGP
jgi:hypothetical protein